MSWIHFSHDTEGYEKMRWFKDAFINNLSDNVLMMHSGLKWKLRDQNKNSAVKWSSTFSPKINFHHHYNIEFTYSAPKI